MREYATALVCTVALTALGSALAYRQDDKTVRTAFSLILICAVVLPLAPALKELLSQQYDPVLPQIDGTEYESVAAAALEEGIKSAVAQQMNADARNVGVKIDGFDFSSMSFERITVTLVGRDALMNIDALKRYLKKNFEGCEVVVEIG